ncbi:hypothetical protein HMPREF1128_1384 [Haemophilus sputorum HK 2154]|uniref:hypothetical protein n=1 Tax=Haemophilus sputorum TaxID=1078480 RepID=UPI000248ABBF|nr:hypothetical protein [Haemophilus sputorum]EJP29270.1 hypothetical protein HMPREF1128_1384 [Haemophilus sputorum HK 2154]
MSKKAAFRIIIENIQIFDEASLLIRDEFNALLFNKIDEVIQDEFPEFKGRFDFFQHGDVLFYPIKWLANNNNDADYKNCFAHYYFGFECDEGIIEKGTYWWITPLFSHKNERMVLGFYSYKKQFTQCSEKEWKNFISEQYKKYETKLISFGFKLNAKEGDIYFPIDEKLEPKQVIECYPDNLVDAMQPIRNALNRFKRAHSIFEQIVEAAKERFIIIGK